MSSYAAREDLVGILERELLGPLNGPEEVLNGVPDVVYLVGRIAPRKLTGKGDPTDADTNESGTDVGDADEAKEDRGVPVSGDGDDGPDGDEDNVEDEPQRRGLMIPASMGMRCQIPGDLEAFTVTASWGKYEPVTEETETKKVRRYKRTPVEITKTIVVAELHTVKTKDLPLQDEVVLRIDRHDDPEGDCRLIELALCNDRETPRKIPVNAWLYQTKLTVTAAGEDAFLPVCDPVLDDYVEEDDELRRLNLQYRDRLEFAVGRTCSVDWKVAEGKRRASAVWTTWLPISETPQVKADEIDAMLDMTALAKATVAELREGLSPIVERYAEWLDDEERRARDLPEHLSAEGLDAIAEARKVQRQLADGLEHLLTDEEALRCFRFMNKVMADQRVQSQVARRRAANPAESIDEARDRVLADGKRAHSWFTFQLAFVLMQLPLLTDPAAARRSGDLATAQLLFFPTGGGKTEAYLGLAAYAFAIRRRQKVLDTPDGPLDGRAGVTVLMRYTLRLLTAQQFQRATALICAAELARRTDNAIWGTEPFRIGLWVGTDVSPKRFDEAQKQLERAAASGGSYRLTVLQIQRCPWCGSPITSRDVQISPAERRVYVYCSDELAECPFAQGGEVTGGLPVLTVDEEIYRLAPAFLIATVDKFARLAREGEAASLFGYVARKCDRHGYVHPDYQPCDIKDGSKHPAKDGLPSAAVRPTARLRPPDLIIQDELHLITGALGTTTGLFEVAIDTLTSWRTSDGKTAQPLVVASTATARNASDQVRALYGKYVSIFPPQVLDAGRTFFSREILVSAEHPGRRYIGISTTGVRLTTAEIRVSEVLMAAGQHLLDTAGSAADPYMTLVAYFSAIRELAGMARYIGDDVQTTLAKRRTWSPLPSRYGTDYGDLNVAELTSRVSSADITVTLDEMAGSFSSEFDSTAGKKERRALRAAGKPVPERDLIPYDAVLATSMLQVGVDVTRLGLMMVVGQPKNTAEYIQASSRVGRDAERPGLVIALGNWARPRDLAHFEQFRHYHETFYSKVEALSVTPFSVTSLDRGLDGVLVSAARVLQAPVAAGLSPERGAGRVTDQHDFVAGLIERLVARVTAASDEYCAERARQRLLNALDQWSAQRKHLAELRKSLVYEKVTDDTKYGALMMSAENAKAGMGGMDDPPFVVANSMREVQPEINLLVSPVRDNLVYIEPPGTPRWEMHGMSLIYDESRPVDPLGDLERESEKAAKHNRAKVGSGRPSTLLYTYGPGAIMDLPQFTIMSAGLDDWDRIWRRRDSVPRIRAPRLLDVVRMHLGSPRAELRPHPWQPKRNAFSGEGNDLGVPARVFPQWLRCTGCDMLGLVSQFAYTNTHPFRTDLACFEHERCTGRPHAPHKAARRTAVPARYLLACAFGHLDEFPYQLWVHHGQSCQEAEYPALRMVDQTAGKGASATVRCESCGVQRPMREAQGEAGAAKLPRCRGRHPHLDAFAENGCRGATKLMVVGASNLWFPATFSIIVMPESAAERTGDLADRIRAALGDKLARYASDLETLRDLLALGGIDVSELTDEDLGRAVVKALAPPPSAEEQEERLRGWDPVDLLVPEWIYLQDDPYDDHHEDPVSGLTLSKRERGTGLRPEITRVLAVERLRKVNALVGFTRIDALDRVGDVPGRLAPLTRTRYPEWTVATEDRGEGIFLQLSESAVAKWESQVLSSPLWAAHRAAHRRNFENRFSETAGDVDPDSRLKPPRYWLVHTLAHVLIRELAMTCGYGAASLSERLYAWPAADGRPPAAGMLIVTTASDSDGTLGGLVQLSEPSRLERVVSSALRRAARCSSDPVCAKRTPGDTEDFLHGAACHCCAMAAETSCERANRFLDRRFLLDLPGSSLGFFS